MKEGYEKLKELGAQKIQEDTHIARVHIQNLIDENFENLNRVQLLGFISILEREYNLDLSAFKNKGLAFFEESKLAEPEEKGVFVLSTPEKKHTGIYIGLVVIVMILVAYFSLSGSAKESSTVVEVVENKMITKVKESIEETRVVDLNISDANVSVIDSNITINQELNSSVAEEESEELKPFVIKAKKVWIGYIDIETHKKYQEILKGELNLDRDKEWILILGHSNVEFYVNAGTNKYSTKRNLYLHYKDGEIEKITLREFKKLNKGRKW